MTVTSDSAVDSHSRWVVVLDDLERLVQRQAAQLDEGLGDLDGVNALLFGPPANMPVLPRTLEARAHQLMQTTDELISRVRLLSAEIEPRGRNVQRRHSIRSTTAPHFDHRA